MKKIIVLKSDGNVAGYDTIQAGVTNAVSGDCVVIYPGTYAETILLKTGVDIHCIGSVNITGVNDGSSGTHSAVVMKISGSPAITIINKYDSGSHITFQNYSNYKGYMAKLTQTGTAAPTVTVLANTIGGTVSFTRTDTGTYKVTISNFNADKMIVTSFGVMTLDGLLGYLCASSSYESDGFDFITTGTDGATPADELLNDTLFEIRYYS